MVRRLPDKTVVIYYLGVYLLLGAVAARLIPWYYSTPYRGLVIALLAAYTLLNAAVWLLAHRSPRWVNPDLAAQVALILALLLIPDPPHDYFAMLFVPVCFQAIFLLPRKNAYIWIGAMSVLASAALLVRFPPDESIGFALTYSFVLYFVAILATARMRAEEANARSQALLAELRQAHGRLQVYASQVEELAAAQERNRLARELHDSVTQTIFSMTLTAQAARILYERDPSRLPGQLEHLQALAQDALAEMRSLIQQLHPRSVAEEGLAAALRRHAAERQAQEGLAVDVQISGARRLPPAVEETLFRVAQEALNNVVKHAGVDRAELSLCLAEGQPVSLVICDHGVGFDPGQAQGAPGHLGLAGMAERVAALGGALTIDSRPGAGTCVRVEKVCQEEIQHA